VILLTVGNPDQAPPAPLIEATVSALREHRTGYAPTIGYPWLREAIAARQARHTGQPCTADNVAVEKTADKPKHGLTGKAPYKFESSPLQR
jgi:arginine:pyruvate transaminase